MPLSTPLPPLPSHLSLPPAGRAYILISTVQWPALVIDLHPVQCGQQLMGMNGAGGAAAEGRSPGGPHGAARRAGDGDALSRPTAQLGSLQLPLPTSPPPPRLPSGSPPGPWGRMGTQGLWKAAARWGRGRGQSSRCSRMESQESYECWSPKVRQSVSPVIVCRGE